MLSTHHLLDSFAAYQSSITESNLIREILKYVSYNSCVLFDYDNTLAMPRNEFATDEMFEMLFKFASLAMQNDEALKLVVMICCFFHYHTEMQPVEDSYTVKILKILNDLNIPTLLVTLRGPELSECTRQQTEKMNLNFSSFWPQGTFELNVGNPDKPVIYSNGKIFCNGQSKADCIKAFFDYIKYQPKNITMVDDKVHHIAKIKTMLRDHFKCEFHGVHYRHLDAKVEKFKNNFDLHAVVPALSAHISQFSDENDVSLSALHALDQYSMAVLKKESLFKYKETVSVHEKTNLNHSPRITNL